MQYKVTYIHKVSQRCECKHVQGVHRRFVEPEKARYPGEATWLEGPCRANGCECKEFSHEFELHELPESLPREKKECAAILRECRLIGRGDRLNDVRFEDDGKIVVFPRASIFHSIIMVPV